RRRRALAHHRATADGRPDRLRRRPDHLDHTPGVRGHGARPSRRRDRCDARARDAPGRARPRTPPRLNRVQLLATAAADTGRTLASGMLNPAWGHEETWAQMANTQMGRRYGLRTTATCMATGSKWSDWQAGVQSTLMTLGNMLMPPDMLTGIGSLDGDNVYSHIEMVLDAEIYDIACGWVEGFTMRDE